MADILARMRQLVGTSAQWAANDLVVGLGEMAIEKKIAGDYGVRIGDGVTAFSALPEYGAGGVPPIGVDMDFDPAKIYVADQIVLQGTLLYRALGVVPAGPWDATQWVELSPSLSPRPIPWNVPQPATGWGADVATDVNALTSPFPVADGQLPIVQWNGQAYLFDGGNGSWGAVAGVPVAGTPVTTSQFVLVAPATIPFSEFLDPAGRASWRIIGRSLECWGNGGGTNLGNGQRYTFPKTFMTVPAVTFSMIADSPTNAEARTTWFAGAPTRTGFTARSSLFNSGTVVPSGAAHSWHAIGEYDGIS